MPGIMSEGSASVADPQVWSTAVMPISRAEMLGVGGDGRASSRPLP